MAVVGGTAALLVVPVLIGSAAFGGTATAGAGAKRSAVPERAALAYTAGAAWCKGLPWLVLAGVGHEESKHGTAGGHQVDLESGVVALPIDEGGDKRSGGGAALGTGDAAEGQAELNDAARGLFGPPLDGTDGTRRIPIGAYGGWHGLSGPWMRAVGPMQILPPTFEEYAVDADGDGQANPHDFDDAAATAARVLCGRRPEVADLDEALLSYNRSRTYVDRVMAYASSLSAPTGTSAMTCPVAGPTSFTDTWHAPRSGGRLHKGVDIFAPRGTPVVAPVAGSVAFRLDRLGGLAFHLWGADGNYYYGAHLDQFGPLSGTVRAGDLLGTVGTTGNAAATPPHLHFEIHVGRAPGGPPAPVNPTAASRAACG